MIQNIKYLEKVMVVAILIATVFSIGKEFHAMYLAMTITLADLLLLFIYLEVIQMAREYWTLDRIRISIPLFIAITALARFIILQEILDRVKEREFNGYSYDGADASFELLVKKVLLEIPEFFSVQNFSVKVENSGSEGETMSSAEVKLKIGSEEIIGTGSGVGPVNALDKALRNNFESSGYSDGGRY